MYAPGAMIETDWKACRVLKSNVGNWGDITKICRSVIRTLDDAAFEIGKEILITSGCLGGHLQDSYHYARDGKLGMALDFMLPTAERRTLPDILLTLLRFDQLGGIGIYADWKLGEGKPAIGGFHVDTRPGTRKALWMKCQEAPGYLPLTMERLHTYFV